MTLDDSEIDMLLDALQALEKAASNNHVIEIMATVIMSGSREQAEKQLKLLEKPDVDKALAESVLVLKAKLIQMRPARRARSEQPS